MLDMSLIREHPERVLQASRDKGIAIDLQCLLVLDKEIQALKQSEEALRFERNTLSREIKDVSGEKRQECVQRVKEIKKELETFSQSLMAASAEFRKLMLALPQPAREDVPVGSTEKHNVVIKTVGDVSELSGRALLSHQQIGERLGLMDFARAVKLSGSRSYVLTGKGAFLEQAIFRMVYDNLYRKGYEAMQVPVLVQEQCMEGTGYFPGGREQAYLCERDQLSLVGTSEVALCSFFQGETLHESELPRKLFALSSCFRREAGSYGKDTKGLYRVHQFQKIEQVIIADSRAELSEVLHAELMDNAEKVLLDLQIPYQVVMVCTGDLGQGQHYKKDIEAWMPSRKGYGETHSCSAFHDFQARRLKIRYKDSEGNKHFCYTLNNTAVASPRILIPLLEVHQTASGDVKIPEALRPYCFHKAFLSEL